MWLNEKNISRTIANYCYHVKDDPKLWKFITEPLQSFLYCSWIKDRPEVRKNITNKVELKVLEGRRNICG